VHQVAFLGIKLLVHKVNISPPASAEAQNVINLLGLHAFWHGPEKLYLFDLYCKHLIFYQMDDAEI